MRIKIKISLHLPDVTFVTILVSIPGVDCVELEIIVHVGETSGMAGVVTAVWGGGRIQNPYLSKSANTAKCFIKSRTNSAVKCPLSDTFHIIKLLIQMHQVSKQNFTVAAV